MGYEKAIGGDEEVSDRVAGDVQRRVKYRARKAILNGGNTVVDRSLVYNFDYPATKATVNSFNMPENAYQPSTTVDKLFLPRPVVVVPPSEPELPEPAPAEAPAEGGPSGPKPDEPKPDGPKPDGSKPDGPTKEGMPPGLNLGEKLYDL